ncbi:S-layer homology domain-containing protein [Paenibacillus peoriae]|uniref:S-layer homology domain-containing protein n=1 Tax=Paenibacillus peoriae TaxID=59893 RepID=UPI00026C5A92|nr:S-layer homology domain-containing protein [Paenibacillus peoriae]
MRCEKKLKRIRQYMTGLLAVWLFCIHTVPVFADRAFNDIEHSYAADAIEAMAAQGYVTGYQDGSFRPVQFISRQEWATIFAKTLKRTLNDKDVITFRDVSPWALPYVQILQKENITKGISDQLFGAKQNMTRQDMAVWYARYLGVSEDTRSASISSFVDQFDISDYAQTSVWLMERLELIEGDTNHYFYPKKFVTRQDATLVAYRVWLGGDDLRERAKRLLESGNGAGTTNQLPSLPEPDKPVVDLSPEIRPQPVNPEIEEPERHSSKPEPPVPDPKPPVPDPKPPVPDPKPPVPDPKPPVPDPKPPVPDPKPPVPDPKPPVPDPKPPVPDPKPPDHSSDFVVDEVVIKAPELINQPETYPSYQLSFQLYKEGQPVSIPAASVTSVTYTFSDALGVFDKQGKIAHSENIPAADGTIPVELEVTIAKPYRVLKAQTKLIVKGMTPPPEDPSVIRSVYLATYTISQATTLDPAAWSMPYVFHNAKGEVIPPGSLPSDLKLRIEDSSEIFDEDGHIANLHLIPAVNSVIPFKIEVESPSQGIHFISDAELTVVPGERKKQYFAVSIMLQGQGGSATTVDQIKQARQLLMDHFGPNLKVTWAMENSFVFVDTNRPQLKQVLAYVDQYGDEVGIMDGYPNNLHKLPIWEARMSEWLYMYRYNALNELHQGGTMGSPSVFESMDTDQYRKYLPKSLTSFTVNPEQAQWLKDHYKITSAMGWSATQYNVNNMFGEGSPLMPYWSNKDNPIVPAQGLTDNSGIVFMNSVTIDPIGSRYTEGSSRWTLHPGDPNLNEKTDAAPQLYIAQQYLDNPYQRLNTVNYMSIILDINSFAQKHNMAQIWENFVKHFPADREVEIVGVDGLKQIYQSSAGSNNDRSEFSLMFRGSGIETPTGSNNSPANLRYLWTENASQRIILSKEDGDAAWSIIDFTDYTRSPVPKLPYNLDKNTDVSYVTGRNFKLNPTAPLTADEIQRVKDRLKEIYFAEEVKYQ